jgi:hypothetical protein
LNVEWSSGMMSNIKNLLHISILGFQKHSTRKLVDRLVMIMVVGFLLSLPLIHLFNKTESEPSQTTLGIIITGLLCMSFVGLFTMGLVLFVRRENPYTVTHEFFGIRLFAYGIVARVTGLLIMILAFLGVCILVVTLLRNTARLFNM